MCSSFLTNKWKQILNPTQIGRPFLGLINVWKESNLARRPSVWLMLSDINNAHCFNLTMFSLSIYFSPKNLQTEIEPADCFSISESQTHKCLPDERRDRLNSTKHPPPPFPFTVPRFQTCTNKLHTDARALTAACTIKHGALGRTQEGWKQSSNRPWVREDKTRGEGRVGGEKPVLRKGVKYIICLPWWKETNAFAVTEDTPPSHIGAHKTSTRFRVKEDRMES